MWSFFDCITYGWQKEGRAGFFAATCFVWRCSRWQKCTMPVCCCVCGFTQRAVKGSSVQFYQFPEQTKLRRLWKKAIKHWNWKTTAYSRICRSHFVTGKELQLVHVLIEVLDSLCGLGFVHHYSISPMTCRATKLWWHSAPILYFLLEAWW